MELKEVIKKIINKDNIKLIEVKKMKQTINENEFITAFRNNGTYKINFSYEGLKALYNYFVELEAELNEDLELDIISICCEYTEYENFEEIKEAYNNLNIKTIEDLAEYTTIIRVDKKGLIIANF